MRDKGFCKRHPAHKVRANGECCQCAMENDRSKRPDITGWLRKVNKRMNRKRQTVKP